MICTRGPAVRRGRRRCVRHDSYPTRHRRPRNCGSGPRRRRNNAPVNRGRGNRLRGHRARLSRCPRHGGRVRRRSAQLARGYRTPNTLTRPRTREGHGRGVGLGCRVCAVDVGPGFVCVVARDQVDYLSRRRGEVAGRDAAVPAGCEVDVCGEFVLVEISRLIIDMVRRSHTQQNGTLSTSSSRHCIPSAPVEIVSDRT